MKHSTIVEPPHLEADLKALQLASVAGNWRRLAEEAVRSRSSQVDYLADLVSLELTGRRERRVERRIKDAHFPFLRTLDAFNFAEQPTIEKDLILELAGGAFVDQHANVVFVGGVGTGKTHMAIALGIACCQREMRVRYVTAAELTNMLVEAKAQGKLSRKLEQLARYQLVILDELGYVPFDKHGADLLFGFVTRVYERRSLIVTTNLAFRDWNTVFLDATAAAAVIDRVIHHATVFTTDGPSHRVQQANEEDAKRKKKRSAK